MRQSNLFLRLFICASLIATAASAQQNVGIGTLTPHASASLEIRDSARGLLIPRLTLQQRNAIANPSRGLLVFVNTDSSFHYYNGTAWQSLQFADTTGWKRTGNAGTNAATHFIGTTDAVPLNFRVNNQRAGRISVTDGEGSTFLGYLAGNNDAMTATQNSFIGYQAGFSNTSGSFNAALGFQALLSNSTGNQNSAMGYQSLQANTTGVQNTAVGYGSLYTNGTGKVNTAMGYQALFSNTSGEANTAIGAIALYTNTTGINNTAVGLASMFTNTTGIQNVALGQMALVSNNTGSYNTAVGYQSLSNSTAVSGTTAIGYQSLYSNTTGFNNTATGYQALYSNTNGYNNTTYGYQTLYSNTIGYSNTAIGSFALNKNVDGARNIAIGNSSLGNNTSGNLNTAIGNTSLGFNSTGNENTAVGIESLYNNSTGLDNTGIGSQAIFTNTTGSNNTGLGNRADVASGNLTNATAIGAFARVAASNSMVLGSINGVNGATASTRVGIGTTQPVAPLHVAGTSGNTSATAMRYFNFSSVGITAEPAWAGSTTIYAEGNVCATQAFISAQSFNFSDARIKQIIGPSNNQQDLERLKQIEVTRYRYIDTVSNGSAVQTKVIAQQLKTVMPEAVSYRSQFIPSIMQLASSSSYNAAAGELTLVVAKLPGELQANMPIKCYAENGTELHYTLVAANGQTLVLKGPAANGRLFVYGHEVKDFHVVDYDAIGMLNVSATQALLQRIETLEATVRKLQQQ